MRTLQQIPIAITAVWAAVFAVPSGHAATPPSTNQPPVVALLAPKDGARFKPQSNILLLAGATDPDGTIASVEFFSATNSLGKGTLVPTEAPGQSGNHGKHNRPEPGSATGVYYLIWQQVPPGDYTITAKATDSAGATTTSAPIHITVATRPGPRRPHRSS